MKRKITCPICRFKFHPTPETRYTAVEPTEEGICKLLSSVPQTRYDAFDCPACGCQMRVGMRFPRSDFPDPIVKLLPGVQEVQQDE